MCQEVWEQRLLWWFKFRSGKSFNVCGSFIWLHYNQTNILENQILLLVLPGGLLVRFFKEFLAWPVLWLSEKLSLNF